MREVLTDKNYKVNGEIVRGPLELSLKEKPLGKLPAMFYKALSDAKGDKDKMWSSWG